METNHILFQGLELMLVGMGTVFTFLAVLVLMMTLMSKLVALMPEEDEPVVLPPSSSSRAGAPAVDAQLLAVLTAAVKAHRSRRR